MFGRKKDKAAAAEDAATTDATPADAEGAAEAEPELDKDGVDEPSSDANADEPAPADEDDLAEEDVVDPDHDEWDELDASRDWRDDGPFDISEVDLADDPVQRLDFGTVVLTPREGMQFQLMQAAPNSPEIQAVLAARETSAMELALFASPASGGMSRQIRTAMLEDAHERGGQAALAEGPFGTEIRAQVPVTGPNGEEGLHVSRTWVATGPRWLLRGVLMGQAALDDADGTAAEFEEFFRDTVVRRGEQPMPPGQLIPMVLPEDMRAQQ